jgi:predicted RNA-binding protein YlxR (DUF448 family)
MAAPIRTCAGCGRKAPRTELVRFAAVGGDLKAVHESLGRGAYTCRRRSCFERALSSRAFNRILGAPVQVDMALRDLYTEDANG